MPNWTWKCGVCGKERDDEDISVLTYPLEGFDPGTAEVNLKYCNDTQSCIDGAIEKAKTKKL